VLCITARPLAAIFYKITTLKAQQGAAAAALSGFKACLSVAEQLASHDPLNAQWERDLVDAYAALISMGQAARQGFIATPR
jgi:hypothetical protein